MALIAWTAWWFTLRASAIGQIDSWLAGQRARGAEASYARVSASGYPLRLTLTFEDAAYAAAGGGWRLSTPKLQLHINPSDLRLFIIEPRDAVTWATRGATRTFRPKQSAISVHVADGAPDRIVVEGKAVAVTRNGAAEMTIATLAAGLRPDPRAASDGQFSLDATGIAWATLPKGFEAFGGEVQSLNARIVFEKGAALLAQTGGDTLDACARVGGAARIEGLGFAWGTATMSATGRFTLDGQRRLAGCLDASLALSSVALTTPEDTRKGCPPAQGRPLRIEDGVMYFNNLRLRTVGPIK